ncbi:olfactory protein-like [Hyla sarda]|uniref:olfactory protein-like n=1 Tax=Hyla sarda TaxID=327740 RepID=UPI0024C3EFDE|nr:olfactory protein-like [Hyla sarda]
MLQVTAAVLLLLFIHCQALDVKVQENFDTSKFVGKWFGVIAASNCEMFRKMKKDMTLPTIMYATDGHSVKNSVAFMTTKGCQQMDANMNVVASGHYTHHSDHGDDEVIIANTDYNSYAMVYRRTTNKDGTCITLNLNGREMKVAEDLKKHFIEHVHQMGLKDEDILIFQKGGTWGGGGAAENHFSKNQIDGDCKERKYNM